MGTAPFICVQCSHYVSFEENRYQKANFVCVCQLRKRKEQRVDKHLQMVYNIKACGLGKLFVVNK